MTTRSFGVRRARQGLAALTAALVLGTPGTAPAFKQGFHEQITEQELQSRGFDVDSADEAGDSNYWTDVFEPDNDAAHGDNNKLAEASARLRAKRTEIGDALNQCERRGALDRLGEALHTVQDLYSHSNSIDNSIPIENILDLTYAGTVCSTPGFAPGGLVTGYFNLASVAFNQCLGLPATMCCHRDLNKDEPAAKNGAQHPAALSAARGATTLYLDLVEQDLRDRFGEAKANRFIKMLEKKQRTTFFVIDDTGSMGNDIAGVKVKVNELLDMIVAGDEAPSLGLVTFKDSVDDRGFVCDVEELRAQVNALFASGGGDCPEFSNSGMLAALSHFPLSDSDMVLKGGELILATDASAKDASFGPAVASEANDKGVSINVILTGDCVAEEGLSARGSAAREGQECGQDAKDFDAPDGDGLIDPLAASADPLSSVSARTQLRALTEQTGGVLFNVARLEVDDVLPTLFDIGRPDVAVVFSRRATLTPGVPFTASVPVDDTMDQHVTFMVTSSTPSTLPAVIVRRPDGSAVAAGDPGVTIRTLSTVQIFTVQAPPVGLWGVEVAGTGAFNLRVFGATSFQLNSVRLQAEAPEILRPELELAPLIGQPFAGDELVADFRFSEGPAFVAVALRRPDGSLLAELDPVTATDVRRFRAAMTAPGETFLVEATGRTAAGADFVRQVSRQAMPQTVALEAIPSGLTVQPETPAEFVLRVRNAATLDSTFRLKMNPELPWNLSFPPTVTVPAGGVVDVPVGVLVPAGTTPGTANAITFFAEDIAAPRIRNSALVTIVAGSPNAAPDCSGAFAEPGTLWPPNHSLRPVALGGVTDPDGDVPVVTITSITQDEPVSGNGSGDAGPDGTGVGTASASVRAERHGKGDGRVYEIRFVADDGNGGICSGSARVGVPHNQGRAPVDSGQAYDSTTSR
jgi:hypothetical protein